MSARALKIEEIEEIKKIKKMGKDTQRILGIIPVRLLRYERETEAQTIARVRASQIRVFGGDVDQARERLFMNKTGPTQAESMSAIQKTHRTDPLDRFDNGHSLGSAMKRGNQEDESSQ